MIMKPVEVRKNEVALDDTSAPVKISFEVDAEAKIIPAVVNARRLLSNNPGISSIQIDMPAKVYEFDDNDQEITSDSVFNYKIDVTRDAVYLEGVNSGYSASVVDVYMDELIEDMNEKIEKTLGLCSSGSSLIKINKEMEDVFKAFAAGEMTSTAATADVFDAVMSFNPDNVVTDEDEEGYDEDLLDDHGEPLKPYDPWEPFENYADDDFASMVDSLKISAESAFLEAVKLIPLEELEAEVERRKIAEQTVSIASVAPDGATLKDAIASLPKTSNPTLKA